MELLKNKKLNAKFFWWLSLFLLLSFFHCRHYLDSDEGIILEGAWNLINNRELYTDFFEFITPGSFYVIFWAWKIFGVHYFIAKLMAILFIFFSAIGAYKISRLTTKSSLSYLVPVILIVSSFHWPIINHNVFVLPFIIWAVYFFIKGLSDYLKKNFIISGLLAGISILFLQHKGIVVLSALAFFLLILLLKNRKLILLKLNLYFIGFAVLPILLLFVKWPVQTLYENLISPLFYYRGINQVFPLLFICFFLFLFYIIFLVRKNKSAAIWLLVFVQFFLLLSALQRPDLAHITFIFFPAYCLLPLVYEKIKTLNKNLRYLNYLMICAIFSLIIYTSFIYVLCFTSFNSMKNSEMILFINENCHGDYIYAGPFLPGVYFETEKLNPSPYYLLLTGFQPQEHFLTARESIIKHQPACAVLDYKMAEKFNYNKDNPVDNYIADNYQITFQSGNTVIYELKKENFAK